MKSLRAVISATSKPEARRIIELLISQKLISGAMVTSGQTIYRWNKKLVERKYWNISAFTKKTHVQRIIKEVKKIHADEVPIISFYEIKAANKEFLEWISSNV